jgi:predicted TPR repeat methyltransferase
VGKTSAGHPFSADQVSAMVAEVVRLLRLGPADHVLDLGCGNGLISREVARHCLSVTGIDFSSPLLSVAIAQSLAPNVRYIESDIRRLPAAAAAPVPSKIFMYEVLQYLDEADLRSVLNGLQALGLGHASLLLAGVPDRQRMWNFYDTPARRAEYEARVANGTEAIGTWWDAPDVERICSEFGYTSAFEHLDPRLDGSRYRFHVLCTRAVRG